jgi:hypothetical protein
MANDWPLRQHNPYIFRTAAIVVPQHDFLNGETRIRDSGRCNRRQHRQDRDNASRRNEPSETGPLPAGNIDSSECCVWTTLSNRPESSNTFIAQDWTASHLITRPKLLPDTIVVGRIETPSVNEE